MQSLSKLIQVQCSSFKPSSHVFVAALKACSSKLTLQQGKLLHAYIIETGHGSDLFVGNTLIDMYAKCKSLEDSCHVFVHLTNRDAVTWNVMIAGAILSGDNDKALQLFQQMLFEGIELDRVTVICTLKACASIAALKLGMQFHACIMENSPLSRDVRVKNTIIDMYSKCGKVESAWQVFDALTDRSVVSWNAMIAGYAQHGNGDRAFELFQQMQSCGMEPNTATCISILKACCRVAALHEGMLIYFHVTESGIELDIRVASALVDMYSKCGTLEDAHTVFHNSSNQDVVMWSALIAGFVYHGLCVEALDLFEKMQQCGIEPNNVTYLSILKACTSMASLDHGKKIHDCIKGRGFEVVTCVGNALMDMYIKCGSLDDARDVFDKLPQRSLVTWSTLIAGNVDHGFCEEALLLFKHMQKEGFEPSSITFSCILRACSSISALAQGKLVHAYSIENSVESDVQVANTLVYMYVKCGSFEDACNTFHDSLEFDVVTWSAMIAGCTDYKQALQYFTSMLQAGLKPNDITFVGLLSACSQRGLVNEGVDHFRSMTKEYGILASFEHYNCMVDLLGRAGCLVEAEMLLLTMPFEPNVIVRTSLLNHSKTLGNVELGKKYFNPWDSRLHAGIRLCANVAV